ncbi:MFS transporter [Nonomuraea sp. NPDC050536]|uniref:MFS transporter n=1 Tax=Nonomuraea sp. NPDC050536 TaxID=3364366 RepID=UPI0037C7C584
MTAAGLPSPTTWPALRPDAPTLFHQTQPSVRHAARPPAPAPVRGNGGARHRNPGRPGLVKVVAAATMALWMADSTATTLVVPALADDRIGSALPVTQLSWMSTISFATIAALLATAGRLADLVGRRAVLALGMAAFGLGACAVIAAPTFPVLLAGRLTQSVGSAMMVPASLALLLAELPPGRRTGALAWWSAASGIGAVLAQAGGGTILAAAGWRAVYVPCAVGALAVLLLTAEVPRSRNPRADLPLPRSRALREGPDLAGALLLVAAIGGAVLVLSLGGRWGWTSPRTLGLAGFAVVALGGAVATSVRHGGVGAIDLRLWRRPGFGFGWLTTLLYGIESFTVLMVAPMYLRAHGMDARQAGLGLAPMSLAVIVAAPLSAMLARRRGPAPVILLSGVTVGVAALLMLGESVPGARSVLAATVMGLGLGALAASTSMMGTLAAEPAQYGAAVGAVTTARMLGGALGVAAASAAMERPLPIGPAPSFATVAAGLLAVAALICAAVLIRGRPHRTPMSTAAPRRTPVEPPGRTGTPRRTPGKAVESGRRTPGKAVEPARRTPGRAVESARGASDLSAEQEVVVLRRLLVELREAFAQVHDGAELELTRLQVDLPRPRLPEGWANRDLFERS